MLLEIVAGLKEAGVRPKDIIVFERYANEFRDAGYEVFLIIEATIGFNRKGKGERETVAAPAKVDDPVRLRITSEDAKFLKSLKIAIDSE